MASLLNIDTLRTLNNILAELVDARPLSESLPEVARRVAELLDADHTTIALLDEARRFFRIETEFPISSPSIIGERITVADRPAQVELLQSQDPVVAPFIEAHPIYLEASNVRAIAHRLNIRSTLIVPIVFNGSTIGTISADSFKDVRSFSDWDVELCKAVATQIGLAVANSRLLDEQIRFRRQSELLLGSSVDRMPLTRVEHAAHQLFELLSRVVQFRKASLQLVVEGKRVLAAAHGFDKSAIDPWLLRPLYDDPIVKQILTQQDVRIVPDTASEAGWHKQPSTFDVNSWIAIPLVHHLRTIGLVTLDHDTPGFYSYLSNDDRNLLADMAKQAARDIHSAYELDMSQRQIQALKVIGDVAESITARLDTEELLPAIAQSICHGLGCSHCNIFFIDAGKEEEYLVCKASWPRRDVDWAGVALASGSRRLLRIGEFALSIDQPTIVDDLQRYTETDVIVPGSFAGARSLLAVPLQISEQTIGVIIAVHDRPFWFGQADQLLLETLTRHAGIAIERGIGLQAVRTVGKDILRATSLDALMKEIVSGATSLTHTDSGVIYLLNETGTQVTGKYHIHGSVHPQPRLDNPHGITRTVFISGTMVAISDISQDTRVNPELRQQYKSMFAVPLKLDTAVVGVLYVNGKSIRKLTDTERSLLLTLADQAALVIQRLQLYQRLNESEAMYHSLVDNIPQCVFRKDRHSNFVSANQSYCDSLGRSLDEVIGRNDFDFYPSEFAAKFVADDKRVIESGLSISVEERHCVLGSNRCTWVRVVKTPVRDSEGHVVGVQAIFWDVTDEKQMTERWRLLVEQSPDSILVHESGVISLANSAAVRLFGFTSSAQLIGHPVLEFVDQEYRTIAEQRLHRLSRHECVDTVTLRILKSNGEKVEVEVYAGPGPTENEAQVVIHDLTRRRTLLREMHHRVRRSLNQVDAHLTLQERFTSDSHIKHAFRSIRDRIQAMALVHTILHDTDQESDVDMRGYLEELVNAVFQAYDTRTESGVGSALYAERRLSIAPIKLDEKRATACGLIATELVSNSLIHAFPDRPGRVELSFRATSKSIQLTVADDGIGIQRESAKSRQSMGLSLVYMLVEKELKGRLKTCDTAVGTHFQVTFPRTTTFEF